MATWEDGPEYAPLDPPDQFTVPDVQPLEEPPSAARQPAAPADRPQFGDPSASVTPLNALVPSGAEQQRDPHAPYRVESATVTGTSGGAWGAAHWHASGAGSEPAAGTATAPPPQPATGSGAQTQALTASPGPAQSVGNYPAPGTPAWFGSPAGSPPAARSGTAPVEQPPPPSVGRAAPIGAVIALACAIFYVLAPFAFLAGFLLSLPAKYARRQLMFAWAGVGGSILVISTLSTLSNYGNLSDWYDVVQTWSLLGSLLMIILIFVIVNHEIKHPAHTGQPPNIPPTPGSQQAPTPPPGWNQPPAAPDTRPRPPLPPAAHGPNPPGPQSGWPPPRGGPAPSQPQPPPSGANTDGSTPGGTSWPPPAAPPTDPRQHR